MIMVIPARPTAYTSAYPRPVVGMRQARRVPRRHRANFPLNVDIIDLILTALSDIHSLRSFVLSSKFVYKAFDARRASVLRTVVSNHLGPATGPAMRLLKVMLDVDSYWNGFSPFPIAKLPREENFQPYDPHGVVVTMREASILATNHDVVQEFEALFSWRKKDPRSTSSRLTPHESVRFQTALYRLWFVCALYGRPAPVNHDGRRNSRRCQHEALRELPRALQSFSLVERVPLFEVWKFVMKLATWAVRAEFLPQKTKGHRSLEAYLVWSGPRATLRAFQGKLVSVMDRKIVPTLAASYEQFCDVLNATQPPVQSIIRIGILDSPKKCFMKTLRCSQCYQAPSKGSFLWSESNWSFLRGIVPPSEFVEFFDIPWWRSQEADPDTLEKVFRNTSYSSIVGGVFCLRSEEYGDWKPGLWLCMTCFRVFMRDNVDITRLYCRNSRFSRLHTYS